MSIEFTGYGWVLGILTILGVIKLAELIVWGLSL